jgi:hypothetical protein
MTIRVTRRADDRRGANMKEFCANDPSHPGPFVRADVFDDGRLFTVCEACATESAREKRGPSIDYDVPEVAGAWRKGMDAAYRRTMGPYVRSNKSVCRDVTPGFLLVRYPVRCDGRSWDVAEARATFRDEPWFAELSHIGSTRRYHLFERPDPDAARAGRTKQGGEVDNLERFRVPT